MKKHKLFLAVLVLISFISFILRFWKIWQYPPLLWDEAALGYNAYSILKTGRDEYGKLLPLIFKSFGDYKPGLYVYLVLPFVKILGLNELAVRIPSIILGALTPLVLYLFIKDFLKDEKVGILTATVLTFMPWHIHFSRGSWEVNVMVFFLVLGSWLFVKGSRFVLFSLISFLFALWTYQGAKIMVPLILFGLITFNFEHFRKNLKRTRGSKKVFIVLIVVIALMGQWYLQSFAGPAKNRLKVMSLFSYHRPQEEIAMILNENDKTVKDHHFSLFHGEWLHFLRGASTRYFNHFSPRFLAFDGDWSNPRHSAPYFGMIGHLNFVLFLIGLAWFLAKKHSNKEYFFLYWLLVSPLPAALTRDIISGVRALPMVIPIAFFVGFALKEIINFRFKKSTKLLIFVGIILFFIFDFVYFSDLYYSHMVKRSPKNWLYGYKEAMNYLTENKSQFKNVFMSDFYGQPYIYYLFYSRYSPKEYQSKAKLAENQFGDVGRVEKIDNVFFRSINWGDAQNHQKTLIIFSADEVVRSEMDKGIEIKSRLIPLGAVNDQVIFYGYKTK